MAAPIGPGDWVEFVGAPTGYVPVGGGPSYKIGALYLVTEVGRRCRDGAGKVWPSLRVAGKATHDAEGFSRSVPTAAFRPIYRPKSSLIESLKQPAPSVPELVEG